MKKRRIDVSRPIGGTSTATVNSQCDSGRINGETCKETCCHDYSSRNKKFT